MPIPNVVAGAIADPDWGNAVVDQLNRLPLLVQHGVAFGTTTAAGDMTVVFPEDFGDTDYAFLAFPRLASTQAVTLHTPSAQSLGQVTVRTITNGSPRASASMTFNWVAIGAPA